MDKMTDRSTRAYLILQSLVICGLTSSAIAAIKLIHYGITFPFSNVIFSILSYPLIDSICEIWGKKAARQAMWIGIFSQTVFVILLQFSILVPAASFWSLQESYASVLSVTGNVIVASFLAISISQLLDIYLYQRIKDLTNGKCLWLRSNISILFGQLLDSIIFVMIVFHQANNKVAILFGSISVKAMISVAMTPVIYLIVMLVRRYIAADENRKLEVTPSYS